MSQDRKVFILNLIVFTNNTCGTSGRTRTGTPKEQQILNLSCLPFHHRGLTTNFYPIIHTMSINIPGFYAKLLCALWKIIAVVMSHRFTFMHEADVHSPYNEQFPYK